MPQGIAQIRDTKQVRGLTADFQPKWDNAFHWSRTVSILQGLPGCRGVWAMSGIGTAGQALDQSSLGNHLTRNGNPTAAYENLIPYYAFDGTGDFLDISDAASGNAYDFIGTAAAEPYIANAALGMSLYVWVKFDNAPGASEDLISKWGADGNEAYELRRLPAGDIQFRITSDGTNVAATIDSVATFGAGSWLCASCRFVPGTEVALFTNGVKAQVATATASIFNSSANFTLGANGIGGRLLIGRESLVAAYVEQHSDGIMQSVFEHTKAMFNVR